MNKVITSPSSGSVRVIDEQGQQLGVMSIADALTVARTRDLDLVEVAPLANPPVCKILDHGKMMYEQSKREKKPKGRDRKEIRMGIRIEDHDLLTKVKNAERFLGKGHEVLVTVVLKGRERATPKLALEMLNRFSEKLSIPVKVVKPSKLGNNRADMVIAI